MANSNPWRIGVEVQLLREWLPRSRPSRGWIEIGNNDKEYPVLLYPGSASIGPEQLIAIFDGVTRVGHGWAVMRAVITIDSIRLCEPRPMGLFLGDSATPSGVVHFPVMAGLDNAKFGGVHSLLVRAVPNVN